ncbi:hypothetical protein [Paraflavitalea sp. CAU 1676]|uniref:hypothetical protein n=1 Tax=Paraflavitalea sp. CAU 1676 TaxID=3032598 RepID=UPI0023D9E86F|nr:hypothetical protein [Paraflavitalea sp. CAU 1676]MDF2188745.1 hypothetical protein [Paraflavitalea sp. CAU 1676]
MKSLYLSVAIILAASATFAQSVAINNDASVAHASAALDIKSSTKGLLIPRLTTAQRTAIAAPAKGLLVFDTDVNSFWFHNGTQWINLAAAQGAGGFALPYAGTASSANNVFSLRNTGNGATLFAGNDAGKAAHFANNSSTNADSNLVEVYSKSSGKVSDNRYGNAASFTIDNTSSVAAAVRAKINTIFGNFGTAALFGESAGTGGVAGLFHASNTTGNGNAIAAIVEGNGNGISATAKKTGNAIEATHLGAGNALYASVSSTGTGHAAKFENFNTENYTPVIYATTKGFNNVAHFKIDNPNSAYAAVRAEINTDAVFDYGRAAVAGYARGTGGAGGYFEATAVTGKAVGLFAYSQSAGDALFVRSDNEGDGIQTYVMGTGTAIKGYSTQNTGRAAYFYHSTLNNPNPVLTVESKSTGPLAVFKAGSTPVNVARISNTGKAFFNGGTQNSGADIAEAFDVTGDVNSYAPGDVLVISTTKDRAVERSSQPYSTLVAGVYATKPGVLLTEENIDSELTGKVPMGVVGVIPTNVCTEGGAIKRGDMLVTSSLPGVAMKADPDKVKPGQVIGKALQDFNGAARGRINVLVNVK